MIRENHYDKTGTVNLRSFKIPINNIITSISLMILINLNCYHKQISTNCLIEKLKNSLSYIHMVNFKCFYLSTSLFYDNT